MRRWILALVLAVLAWSPAVAGAQGRWESRPAAPAPKQEAAFAALDGKLHFVGGFEYGGADSARHEFVDVRTGSWTIATPLPEPAHHLQAAGIGDRLYVVGGLQTLAFVPTGRLWAYEPAAAVWEARASLPAGRERGGGAAVAHAGRLYYLGGLRDGDAVAQVDVYEPAADTWAPLPDMPIARDHLGAAVVGDQLYVVGGRQAAFETEIAGTHALDLKTLAWRTGLAPLPTPRAGFAAAAIGDEIVTVGGESPDGVHPHAEAYHPATDTWRALAPMPLPRHGIQGAAVGDGLWIAGGGTDLLVAASAALDVLFPGPRPLTAVPPAGPPAASPPRPRPPLRLGVRVARRQPGVGHVAIRVSASRRVRMRLLLRDRRGRAVARGTVSARPAARRVRLPLRRPLRPGRYTLIAQAEDVTVRRRTVVRR